MKFKFVSCLLLIFLMMVMGDAKSEFTGDPSFGVMTYCKYYHNEDLYKTQLVFTNQCPDVNPPAEDNGVQHMIKGQHPTIQSVPGRLTKIDTHDCQITIIYGNAN